MGIWKDFLNRGHRFLVSISGTQTDVGGFDSSGFWFSKNKVLTSSDGSWSNGYTITNTDGISIIEVGVLSTNATIAFPLASTTLNKGRTITISNKNSSTNTLNIDCASGIFEWQDKTLNAPLYLNNGDTLIIQSNGSTWKIINYTGLGLDNFIINGNADIAQRGTAIQAAGSFYSLDRFLSYSDVGTGPTLQKISITSSRVAGMEHLTNGIRTTCSGVTASSRAFLGQRMEGYIAKRLKSKSITVSFWIRASANFTFCFHFYDGTKSFLKDIAVTSSWQYISINISPTSLIIDETNGIGYHAIIEYKPQTVTGVTGWNTGDVHGIAGTNYLFNNQASNWFEVTGIMMNIGGVPAPFALAGRDYNSEFALCQRYFLMGDLRFDGYAVTGVNQSVMVFFPVEMRVAATPSINNNGVPINMSVTPNLVQNSARFFSVYHTGTSNNGANFIDTFSVNAEL